MEPLGNGDDLLYLKEVLEALLVATPRSYSLTEIAERLSVAEGLLQTALDELEMEMTSRGRGLYLARSTRGFRIQIKPHLADVLVRFMPERAPKPLTDAAREVLAIIVWNQPVSLPEISRARGVDSEVPLATLIKKKLVMPARERRGRAKTWKTSRYFLEFFELESLDDLRNIQTRRRIFGEGLESWSKHLEGSKR